jgi:hypothetical protein
MPALFTLPKQIPLSSAGLLLPGAKLTFSQTGTATLQNTYQDVLLATPHANPVVADASGVFAPIYLDPSLPNYRVKLTTAADVQVYQVDDVPSNQNTAQSFKLVDVAPELIFEQTGASANNKKWAIRVASEAMTIDLLNDAESVRTTVVTLTRSGTTSLGANFTSDQLLLDGDPVSSEESTSFTATLTGMTSDTSGLMTASRVGQICKINAVAVVGSITGTSNTTAMTLTGVPSDYRPKAAAGNRVVFCTMIDNGVTVGGQASISTAGVITFGIGINGSTAFTNSGTKGLPSTFSLVYPI